MTAELVTLDIRTRQEWRIWLQRHHASSPGIWLTFYKGHTGVESVCYEDSVREALCFGWVDSLIKRIDQILPIALEPPTTPSAQERSDGESEAQLG